MYKLSMRLLIASLLAFLQVSLGIAGENDFTQPITVDSQSQFVDGKNKVSIFRGDVNISQGSLTIDADEVEVDASQGEGKEVFIARGKPATYSQELDDGQRVVASAKEIRYVVSDKTIELSGDAELLRDTSSVSGSNIIYDMAREQLLAEGKEGNDSRVTTIFRPETLKKQSKDNDQ